MQDVVYYDPKQETLKELINEHFRKQFPELELYLEQIRKNEKLQHREFLLSDRLRIPSFSNILVTKNEAETKRVNEKEEAERLAKDYKNFEYTSLLKMVSKPIDDELLIDKVSFLMQANYLTDTARLEIIAKQLKQQDREERLKEIENEQNEKRIKTEDMFEKLVKIYASKAYENVGYSQEDIGIYHEYLTLKYTTQREIKIEKNQKITNKCKLLGLRSTHRRNARDYGNFILEHYRKYESLKDFLSE